MTATTNLELISHDRVEGQQRRLISGYLKALLSSDSRNLINAISEIARSLKGGLSQTFMIGPDGDIEQAMNKLAANRRLSNPEGRQVRTELPLQRGISRLEILAGTFLSFRDLQQANKILPDSEFTLVGKPYGASFQIPTTYGTLTSHLPTLVDQPAKSVYHFWGLVTPAEQPDLSEIFNSDYRELGAIVVSEAVLAQYAQENGGWL